MKNVLTFLFINLIVVTSYSQSNYYVNDNSTLGDVFTTAVGNDANPGTAAAPFATLTKAYLTALSGDVIYMDAGTYNNIVGTIGKQLTIRGTNYNISPNDPANPLNANPARNAETIINMSSFTIGSSNIDFSGFSFYPQTGVQFVQTNNTIGFNNVKISNNIFHINSGNPAINITGKQVYPLVTFNYNVTDNMFIKEDANNSMAILLSAIDIINVNNNTFMVASSAAYNKLGSFGMNFRTDNLIINNNTAYRANNFIGNGNAKKMQVTNNKVIECNRFALVFNGLPEGSVTDITDNVITNPKSTGGPVISYAKSNGFNLTDPNIARIERNTITLNGTGLKHKVT